MLDIRLVREEPEKIKAALKNRNSNSDVLDELIKKDLQWRKMLQFVEELRGKRNLVSKEINELLKAKKDAKEKMREAKEIPQKISELEEQLREAEKERLALELLIPNIPQNDVPIGKDESQNKVIKTVGAPRKFTFKQRDHHEIGEALGILDFERGAKLSGERFTVIKKEGAILERALINFMLDLHRKKGYVEISPPLLVRPEVLIGTGQLPKFEEDLYKMERDNLYAIPTSEVVLTNLHADEFIEHKSLPFNYCAYTPCFRREAGSHGKDTRGIIRQHQFDKVELVKITDEVSSNSEHLKMLKDAEDVLVKLGLPYRVNELCTGDMGFSAARTYDVEVWLPGQSKFREISSVSNCLDFQSRRAKIKYRSKDNTFKYCHTLNGSGLAVGRTFVAILENFQEEDGSVKIPEALKPYMGGIRQIG
ncbi:serine--tRNA ligase [Candidatus Micrarchaeota archaeon]|nr:serine--tRNA ligase [Candidatus Micrarchaeota archaeon]